MFLKLLVVKTDERIIRTIPFKDGVNLIIDSWKGQSGNSVGKTTLLRVIDYCFGSNWEDIYTDREFKNKDPIVYDFLEKNKVIFNLTILINEKEYLLQRRFNSIKDLRINNIQFDSIEQYRAFLNEIIFWITEDKPSLRQMIPKFIRKDVARMTNVIKYLHSSARQSDYMLIYFQLFNFRRPDLILKKSFVIQEKKQLSDKLRVIKGWNTKNALKQEIKLLEHEIDELEKKIQCFDVIDSANFAITQLSSIQDSLYKLRTKSGSIGFRLKINAESIDRLNAQISDIDLKTIEDIYKSAKIYLPNLQRSFQDVVRFHNQMVWSKIKLISDQSRKLSEELLPIKKQIKQLETEESVLLRSISNKEIYADMHKIQSEIKTMYEKKWESKKILDMLAELEAEIEDRKKGLEEIESEISVHMEEFEDNISIFNKFFKHYSHDLYGEDYYINFSDDYKTVQLWNFKANVWWGEKKACVALFDLSYISYLAEIGSPYCRFVMHDSVEDTSSASIEKIFSIANSIGDNGQYVVSLLKEKISFMGESFMETNSILELDVNNKFFKIELDNRNLLDVA
jgi:uncharacterized protein YydD (DUF2326 family)